MNLLELAKQRSLQALKRMPKQVFIAGEVDFEVGDELDWDDEPSIISAVDKRNHRITISPIHDLRRRHR